MDRLTAVMTLVEGHGDYGDGRGRAPGGALGGADQGALQLPAGIGLPHPARARACILGIDLKMKQYAEGSEVRPRGSWDVAGMEVFNKVWTSPETLPTRAEFSRPEAWLDRVAPDR